MNFIEKIKQTMGSLFGALGRFVGGEDTKNEVKPLRVSPTPEPTLNPQQEELIRRGMTQEEYFGSGLDRVRPVNPNIFPTSTPASMPPLQGQVLGAEAPTVTPNPYPTIAPGSDLAMNFVNSQIKPTGTPTGEYYPVAGDEEFMQGVSEADKLRQGLTNLLLLQAFFESTMGRTSKNIFGTLPGGEGSGVNPQFSTPSQALEYQLGPNVLGGGANPNMNILGESTPIDRGDVETLYKSYNPSGDYLQNLLKILFANQ